jgi:hypothetical protein
VYSFPDDTSEAMEDVDGVDIFCSGKNLIHSD